MGQLGRGPGGERLTALLARSAPTWLGQLPQLVDAAGQEVLQRQVLGATKKRMLREIVLALEALSAERPAGVGAGGFALE